MIIWPRGRLIFALLVTALVGFTLGWCARGVGPYEEADDSYGGAMIQDAPAPARPSADLPEWAPAERTPLPRETPPARRHRPRASRPTPPQATRPPDAPARPVPEHPVQSLP